jgi:hypothetical protein
LGKHNLKLVLLITKSIFVPLPKLSCYKAKLLNKSEASWECSTPVKPEASNNVFEVRELKPTVQKFKRTITIL